MGRYLRVTLDKWMNWSPRIEQFRRIAAQRLRVLIPILKRKSLLSIRNGFLPYKKLFRPKMDNACPICRFAAPTHIRRLQVLQSKCLRLPTDSPRYIGKMQIHEDL